MNFLFKLPQSGVSTVLERIEEIAKLTGLLNGVERSDQLKVQNLITGTVNTLSGGLKTRFGPVVEQIAKEHNVDPKIIKAIIERESGFDPNAISKQGAIGLMQLMPGTAREAGVKNIFDPIENIRGGTKYFSSLLNRYHGNVVFALSAYNSGPNNVDKYKGVPPFEETRKYVTDIMGSLT